MIGKFDKDFNIGGFGIDTQLERDIIDYRPEISYKKNLQSSFSDLASEPSFEDQMGEVIGGPSVVSTWEEIADSIRKVDELEKKLSEKLNGTSVPIEDKYLDQVRTAAAKWGYTLTDSLPFELYKKTFDEPDSPESTLIQDIYEDYQADVNGNINAELYPDVIEIQKDLSDTVEFMKKGLFAQFVSPDELAGDLDESKLEQIHQREKELLEQYAEILKKNKQNEDLFHELILQEYGSDRYFQVENDLEQGRREAFILEKKLFTKKEIVDLLKRKASDIGELLELIQNYIDFDPLKEDRYEILYHVSRQFDQKEKMVKEMKGLQAVLKFAIDSKKKDVFGKKLHLRGLAGPKIRQKVNQTLINSIHFRNGVLTGMSDWLGSFDGVPDNTMFDLVIGYVTEGMQKAEGKYRLDVSDFYKIHAMSSELRREKITSIVDKDIARQTYRLFGNMVNYAKNANIPRPNDESFGNWLREFIGKNHLG